MKLYFAPMEGITKAPFRQVYRKWFEGIDRFYTPFLSARQTFSFKRREIRDILPENNTGIDVVPQVLANKSPEFVWAVFEIAKYGYREINLNLGCSMPMVAKRGMGAGFLADPDRLDRFFDESFRLLEKDGTPYPDISVKIRTGTLDHAESDRLLPIWNRYPFSEVIVHPRLMSDLYKNKPDWDVFEKILGSCTHPVCYNGDIVTYSDYLALMERFPSLNRLMMGRGILRNPSLPRQIRGGKPHTPEELRGWLDDQLESLFESMGDERQAVGHMKEIWYYLSWEFPGCEKEIGKIRKARTALQYGEAVDRIFDKWNE